MYHPAFFINPCFVHGFLLQQKGTEMKTISFIADGKTADFYFTFNYFLKSDIIVCVNGTTATNYNLVCTASGRDADFPFVGGYVHFAKPPKIGDKITICRNLPMKRIADYQPTEQYNPITLNRDLNYIMEILTDMTAELDIYNEKFADIANLDLIREMSDRINIVLATINSIGDSVDEKLAHIDDIISQFNDIAKLRDTINNILQSVEDLGIRTGNNEQNIGALNEFKNSVTDHVVAFQSPTSQNNYTWYRKYASGWVEQGSRTSNTAALQSVTLPIEMADTSYAVYLTRLVVGVADDVASISQQVRNMSTTAFQVRSTYATAGAGGVGGGVAYSFNWFVCGICKTE